MAESSPGATYVTLRLSLEDVSFICSGLRDCIDNIKRTQKEHGPMTVTEDDAIALIAYNRRMIRILERAFKA